MDPQRIGELVARLRDGETVDAAELDGTDRDRFATGLLGLRWDQVSLDRVTGHLEVEEKHHQPYGIVHGGVWCAVVETMASFGAALHAAAAGKVVVGVSNTTDFLRAHRRGRVDVEARPVHIGRSQQLWQVVLTRHEDGKAVARGQVRLQALAADQIGGAGAAPDGTPA